MPPIPGATVIGSLQAALDAAAATGAAEIMVIGGGLLFDATMGSADRLYITHVHARPEGDAMFPPIDPALWRVVAAEPVPSDAARVDEGQGG